jgi:hypothetical protein
MAVLVDSVLHARGEPLELGVIPERPPGGNARNRLLGTQESSSAVTSSALADAGEHAPAPEGGHTTRFGGDSPASTARAFSQTIAVIISRYRAAALPM